MFGPYYLITLLSNSGQLLLISKISEKKNLLFSATSGGHLVLSKIIPLIRPDAFHAFFCLLEVLQYTVQYSLVKVNQAYTEDNSMHRYSFLSVLLQRFRFCTIISFVSIHLTLCSLFQNKETVQLDPSCSFNYPANII